MSRAFAPGAARLAGLAARLLGWRPAEFWNATPAELAVILDAGPPPERAPSRAEIAALMTRLDGPP